LCHEITAPCRITRRSGNPGTPVSILDFGLGEKQNTSDYGLAILTIVIRGRLWYYRGMALAILCGLKGLVA